MTCPGGCGCYDTNVGFARHGIILTENERREEYAIARSFQRATGQRRKEAAPSRYSDQAQAGAEESCANPAARRRAPGGSRPGLPGGLRACPPRRPPRRTARRGSPAYRGGQEAAPHRGGQAPSGGGCDGEAGRGARRTATHGCRRRGRQGGAFRPGECAVSRAAPGRRRAQRATVCSAANWYPSRRFTAGGKGTRRGTRCAFCAFCAGAASKRHAAGRPAPAAAGDAQGQAGPAWPVPGSFSVG